MVGLGVLLLLIAATLTPIIWRNMPGEAHGGDATAGSVGEVTLGDAASTSSPIPGATGSATPPPGATRTAVPTTYPRTADEYARATLTAWLARDDTRLGQLARPGALTLMGRAPSGLPGGWEFYGCWVEPFAPCRQLRNDRGDVYSVSVDPAALGKPKAVTRAYVDVTRYEATAIAYVQRAIDAWDAKNEERIAYLVDGQSAVWFFNTVPSAGDHNAYDEYREFASQRDPVNLICVQAHNINGYWQWAIDKRLFGKPHALVWAGIEQVC